MRVVGGAGAGHEMVSVLAARATKAERVAHYCANMNKEIDMIAHSCGLKHAREFRREHVRIVQASGQSVALNVLYPYPAVPPTEGLLSV